MHANKIRLLMELRNYGVTDTKVLAAIELTPREKFVSRHLEHQAYANHPLPIGCQQTISQPLIVALMTQALVPDDRLKVLEIGTGSGYQTAVLARLFRRVYSIERHRPLLKEAERRLQDLRHHNVTTIHSDGTKGWPEQAPFERIIVTAAAPQVPDTLAAQLSDGGIMVVPVGEDINSQNLLKITRSGNSWEVETMFPVRFVPLVGGALPDADN